MAIAWKLRNVMAEKGIWSGAELGRLLEDKAGYKLSPPSISALLTSEPKQVKTQTMDALCTALECSPNDLWQHTPTPIKLSPPKKETVLKAVNGKNNDRLPPI
ncbi:helix-turn-helix domain-containing protein [Peribacillus frigoritolerans]|uniref:helix-turn-helix domain-containing protein n=1 Tax=Peribacillus frigoritolerans TaxID=450367 RepID=UPI0007BF832D|nr:helix-turn-helix transcriptional regulator [Peribacillus frigoritolerans]